METIKAANEEIRDDVVSIDLPAPQGWKKKFTPKKGGTPRRKEIVFISPTGEDIKNKRQLDQYLKSHPGGLSASEFDWGTGSTPRRSARISELSKATESPESEPPKKAQKKSSSKKGEKENDDIDGKGDTAEEMEAAKEEITGSAEVEMKDAEVIGDHTEGEDANEDASTDKNNTKGSQPKTEIEIGDVNEEKPENEGATNGTSCAKEDEEGNNKSLLMAALEENTEAEKEQALPEAPSQVPEKEWAASEAPCGVPVSNETASSVQAEKIEGNAAASEGADVNETASSVQAEKIEGNAAASEGADVKKTENESKNVEDGQEDQPNEESAPIEKVINIEEDKNDEGSLKNREAGIPAENYSASQEEAPHEPKSPQVSC